MRTVLAIVAYLMAAVGGLAAGYYATAPRASAAARARMEAHEPHRGTGSPADLEAVAAYLAGEERQAGAGTDAARSGF